MIVGVAGAKRSGKDTLGRVLFEERGFVRVSFARPIKEMLGSLYQYAGMTEEQIAKRIDGARKELEDADIGASPRMLMITLGTEWARDTISRDFWINIARKRIKHIQEVGHENIVITDVRFPNEVKLIEELGGITVCVRRPSVEPSMTLWAKIWRWLTFRSLHPSETLWSKKGLFDAVIFNDGTKAQFEERVRGFVIPNAKRAT